MTVTPEQEHSQKSHAPFWKWPNLSFIPLHLITCEISIKPVCPRIALTIVESVVAVGGAEAVLAVWPVSSAALELIFFVAVQGM